MLSGLLLVVQLEDLVYLAIVGGVPRVARAAEMNARIGSFGSFGWITFGLASVLLGRWYRAFAGIARRTGAGSKWKFSTVPSPMVTSESVLHTAPCEVDGAVVRNGRAA